MSRDARVIQDLRERLADALLQLERGRDGALHSALTEFEDAGNHGPTRRMRQQILDDLPNCTPEGPATTDRYVIVHTDAIGGTAMLGIVVYADRADAQKRVDERRAAAAAHNWPDHYELCRLAPADDTEAP
jgi:hypothetical protein